jgi:hypothetical protein
MLKKSLIALCLISATSVAADLDIQIELPTLNVAEYHNPYVAVWLQTPDKEVKNLSVWYQLESRGEKSEKGEEWLKDMRQWWRAIGRSSDMPIDGVSGATKKPGVHQLQFTEGKTPLEKLAKGDYVLMVEAAREVGGRELIKIPFTWPVQEKTHFVQKGKSELGEVRLSVVN